MLFQRLLASSIKEGTLWLITADGRRTVFGTGGKPRVTVRLHNRLLEWTLPLYPQLSIGEAYIDGTLTIEDGTLGDFLNVLMLNMRHSRFTEIWRWVDRAQAALQRVWEDNPIRRARQDVSAHYDLSPKLYEMFLDSDRQYSCAYFENSNVSLEKAQQDKKRHIASKLWVRQGQRVLDIGSGWGGLGLYLSKEAGCDVTGLTLSHEQHASSNERARREGLDHRCRFALRDFRHERATYDRIVSVGMFEHVGSAHYDAFFQKIRELLTEDGVCLLHSIGQFQSGVSAHPFIRKHIFPGSEIPSLSVVLRAIERAGLIVTDIEILRQHYAETLKHWYERFQAHRAQAAKLYDERFCRKWEFYLKGCEESFRLGRMMVFQIQLTKKLNTLPITRDYMREWEELVEDMPSIANSGLYRHREGL